MGRFNGTQTIVDIAGSAGLTPLLATGPVRFVRGVESLLTAAGAANTLQGFQYQIVNPDGTVGQWISVDVPATEGGDSTDTIMQIGDPMSLSDPRGSIIGNGPGFMLGLGPTAAQTLCNLRSLTVTATSVMIQQDY